LLVAFIGLMVASKADIYLRELSALKAKAVSTALEMSMPIVDALETFIRIVQQVSILIKIKNTVNFKSIVVTSILAVTRLQIKLGGIVHACLTPRLAPAPSHHLA